MAAVHHSVLCNSSTGGGSPPIQPVQRLRARGLSRCPSYDNATVRNLMDNFNVYKNPLLTLSVEGGSGLRTAHGHKPSPFCLVSLVHQDGHVEQKHKTKTSLQEQNPQWDEEVALEIPNTVTGIRVEVLSYRLLHKNTLFGLVEIPRAQFGVCMFRPLELQQTKEDQERLHKHKHSKDHTPGQISMHWTFTTALERNMDFRIARDCYSQIEAILLSPGYYITSAICGGATEDTVALTLVRLFNRRGQAKQLVVRLLTDDMGMAIAANKPLLRADSSGTRAAKHYFKLIGHGFLARTLEPQLLAILEDTAHFETEPERARPGEDVIANAERLAIVSRAVVNSIFQDFHGIPLNIRQTLFELKQILTDTYKQPDLSRILGLSLFFLRFVCPSIMFPEQYYICTDEISPEARRVLTLITKVIQCVANTKQELAEVDPSLRPVLPEIDTLRIPMEEFLNQLMETPSGGTPDEPHSILRDDDYPKILSALLRKITEKWDCIDKSLNTKLIARPLPPEEEYRVKRDFAALKSIIGMA